MNKRLLSRILFMVSVIALVVGAAFHGYRMHPENVEAYKIGVTMGIVMISIFVISLVAGIVMSVMARKE